MSGPYILQSALRSYNSRLAVGKINHVDRIAYVMDSVPISRQMGRCSAVGLPPWHLTEQSHTVIVTYLSMPSAASADTNSRISGIMQHA
jgi:hypothetical protein